MRVVDAHVWVLLQEVGDDLWEPIAFRRCWGEYYPSIFDFNMVSTNTKNYRVELMLLDLP